MVISNIGVVPIRTEFGPYLAEEIMAFSNPPPESPNLTCYTFNDVLNFTLVAGNSPEQRAVAQEFLSRLRANLEVLAGLREEAVS